MWIESRERRERDVVSVGVWRIRQREIVVGARAAWGMGEHCGVGRCGELG